MKLSDKMLEFVRSRKERGEYIADALDAFLETFLPDDETAAEAAFRAAWSAAAAPSAPTRPPSKAGQGRPRPNSPKDRELQELLTAPFRFLPLNEVIAQPEAEIITAWQNGHLHELPLTGGYCGQLALTLTFDGPVLVAGSGNGDTAGPVKIGDDPVIPGATLRGLTRATLEAAAFARLSQTNLHRRFGKGSQSKQVKDVLANTAKGAHLLRDDDTFCPDFVEALFGYVHEPADGTPAPPDQHKRRHLKSRLAFGFARLAEGAQAIERPPVTTVQAAPKPSFAPFYLSGQGRKDWSQPGVELAGRKVYPPRGADVAQVEQWLRTVPQNDNPDTQSKLRFLAPASGSGKLVFTAEIRVHNVTAAELGGLIWALTLGGNDRLRHMIGRAKTAGAGQAQITVDTAGISDLRGRGLLPDAARAAFAVHMAAQVKGWEGSAQLRALLHAANPSNWKGKPLSYLPLNGHKDLRRAAYTGNGPKRFLGVPTT